MIEPPKHAVVQTRRIIYVVTTMDAEPTAVSAKARATVLGRAHATAATAATAATSLCSTRKLQGGWVKNVDSLPKTLQGLTRCRWCDTGVKKPRRTFCSDACVHQHRLRSNSGYLREMCYARDKGVCAVCFVDTKKLAREIRTLERLPNPYRRKKTKFILRPNKESIALRKTYNITPNRKLHQRKLGGGMWDADHVLSVRDGGGMCGLDNIQTLCIRCHKEKTKRSRIKTKI